MSEERSEIQVETNTNGGVQAHITPAPEGEETTAAPEGTTQETEAVETPVTEEPQLDQLKIDETPKDPLNNLFEPESMSKLQHEVSDNGFQFTEDHYKLFEEKGIPREFADSYLAGQRAQAQAFVSNVAKECGGQQQLQATLDWAAKNLDPAAVEAINAQLATMNADVAITAIKGLQARAGLNTNKTLSATTGGGSTNTSPFADESEFREAMANPKFDKSPNYRAQVQARLNASVRAGTVKL